MKYYPLISIFVRSCDSRNLHASPFCNLAKSSNPSAWAKDVNEVYDLHRKQAKDNDSTKQPYLPDMAASERETYPSNAMKQNELLTIRLEVTLI